MVEAAVDILGVASLGDIERLPPDVRAVKGRDLGDDELALLGTCSALVVIDLSGCEKITDAGLQHLALLPHLLRLGLGACVHITNQGLRFLARIISLEELDLSGCDEIGDDGLRALATLPQLRLLNLNWCYGVSDAGMEALGQIRTLKAISLWSCEEITDAGVNALCTRPQLESVELPEFARITDNGIKSLVARAPSLKMLRLANLREVSDLAFHALTRAQRLGALFVSYCPGLTDEGIKALSTLKEPVSALPSSVTTNWA